MGLYAAVSSYIIPTDCWSEKKFECDEFFDSLQNAALLLSKADLYLRKGHKLKFQWPVATESDAFVQTKFILSCL